MNPELALIRSNPVQNVKLYFAESELTFIAYIRP